MPVSYLLVRHGESTYNERGLVNGQPTTPVALTERGRRQARDARRTIGPRAIDCAVHTRFPRTVETLEILLDGRDVPTRTYGLLDDVQLGEFEGRPLSEYRAWRHEHTPADRPPGGGESRLDALDRYHRGFSQMRAEPGEVLLAVLHDVPIRFMCNAAAGDDPLDGPIRGVANASVHEFTDEQMRVGLQGMASRLGL